jgi:uncharacterized protein YcbK (DUF882 family)
VEILKLILSIINAVFKGTANEKDAKENGHEKAKADGQGLKEALPQEANAQKENAEQKSLQVKEGYMITLKEILKATDFDSLPKEHQDNLLILLERINRIRTEFAKPMTVSSGYRSMAEHLEIYRKKGITDQSKIPMKSRHLIGAAIDIYDPNQQLQKWVLDNVKILEEVGLWCEDFSATPNWVHFQIVPPASGKRFFKP